MSLIGLQNINEIYRRVDTDIRLSHVNDFTVSHRTLDYQRSSCNR